MAAQGSGGRPRAPEADGALVLAPEEQRAGRRDVLVRWLAVAQDTGGALAVGEHPVPPGGGPLPHRHMAMDEAFYVLEGTLVFAVGDRTATAPPGTFVYVPRGVEHAITNPGAGPARMLVIFAPAGFEGMWEDLAELQRHGPPSPEVRRAVDRRYATEYRARPWRSEEA
jgi:quercetin dioxygenase-like cupin family protein